jgi:hypothetical protein
MDLLAVIQQDTPLKRVAATGGGEYAGACPWCAGTDRFRVWPARGRYWCRQCLRRGDLIQYLRDYRGLSFQEAARLAGKDLCELPALDQRRQRVRQRVLSEYSMWQHVTLAAFADQYQACMAEVEAAGAAYRLLWRAPELFTEDEASYWVRRLGALLDRQAWLEYHLDLLTYHAYEKARFRWFDEQD